MKVALPKLPPEYSLTMVRSDGDRGRLFLRSDRRRVETDFANGHRHIVIARGDLGVGWLWQNDDPWIETSIDWNMSSGISDPADALFWRDAGLAFVDDQECRHYVGYPDASAPVAEEECFVSISNNIRLRNIRRRRDGFIGLVTECKDIVIGPPPLELFEPPPEEKIQRIRRRRRRH